MKKRNLDAMTPVLMEPKGSSAKRRRFFVSCSRSAKTMIPTESSMKRKRSTNIGAEDTTVFMEPRATLAKRRKLSFPCCYPSEMAMTRFGSSTNGCNKRKSADDTLRLHARPCGTQMKRRRLNASKYLQLDVKEGNRVEGEILGHRCVFLVDSGSNSNCMFLSQAENFGLVTGNEKKETQVILMWNGYKKLQNIQLEEVAITLEGCMTMRIPIKVFPREQEKFYPDHEEVILGQQFLQPGRVFQEFSASGASKLYIRKPQQLQQPPKRLKLHKPLWLEVQGNGSQVTDVLLDTGAPGFYTTKLLMQKIDYSVKPQYATIHLGDGSFLNTGLEVRKTNDQFFILGCNLLYKYEAVVDYSGAFITFKVGSKYLRVFGNKG